jgi:CxxC motif-containing protein
MKKEIICTICPNSCRIKVEYEGFKILNIDGAKCKKGEEYVKNEILNPVRVFTGSVMVEGGNFLLASVKTNCFS